MISNVPKVFPPARKLGWRQDPVSLVSAGRGITASACKHQSFENRCHSNSAVNTVRSSSKHRLFPKGSLPWKLRMAASRLTGERQRQAASTRARTSSRSGPKDR